MLAKAPSFLLRCYRDCSGDHGGNKERKLFQPNIGRASAPNHLPLSDPLAGEAGKRPTPTEPTEASCRSLLTEEKAHRACADTTNPTPSRILFDLCSHGLPVNENRQEEEKILKERRVVPCPGNRFNPQRMNGKKQCGKSRRQLLATDGAGDWRRGSPADAG